MPVRANKRRKASRFRGSHTHGRGFTKKARGSGHQGGVGMAGTGKRGDQKKTLVLNAFGNDYFGKSPARRKMAPTKYEAINISSIVDNLASMIRKGSAKESNGTYIINLKGFKVLSDGETTLKLHITVPAASKLAIEKIKKAGGEVILTRASGDVSSKAPKAPKAEAAKPAAVKAAPAKKVVAKK